MAGQRSSWPFLEGAESGGEQGSGEGVKATLENAFCDGKVFGDKGGNRPSLALH